MIVVLVLSLPFLYILLRKPVLRRLALRNASRRPRETMLVILGSLLGTAIMTGSFVVGDTFNSSIRRIAHEQLGPVDEVVSTNGVTSALADRFVGFSDPSIDGVLPLTVASASAASNTTPPRAAPLAQLIETDFTRAHAFGGDASATGISGPTPGPGETAIGSDVANALHARSGDTIDVFAYGQRIPLRVTRVLPRLGVAGFWTMHQTTSNNLFVAPGTIARLAANASSRTTAPPQSLVLVSNKGSVEGGAALTDRVVQLLHARLGTLQASVIGFKKTVLDRATLAGKSLSRLYTSLGAFAVLAGILLLVNIFFMLADERKSELGMLRAIGLRRASLIGGFATEGWCYALVSAILGTFVGLALGRGLIAAASKLFASRTSDDRLTLHFSFQWASVQRGLIVGFIIALGTVVLTSIWLSRFNIIQAIRDITEPARRRPRRRSSYVGLGVAVIGLFVTAIGVAVPAFLALMLGPAIVLMGIGPTLARNLPRTAVTTAIGVMILAWAVLAVPVAIALGGNVDVVLFVVQGLVLVGAAVVIVSQHQAAIGHALSRFAPRSLRLRLGLAYPLARRFRTSMTLGMFALVVFILVMVSVFSAMFASQLDRFTRETSGGFNVVTDSNPTNPVSPSRLAAMPGVRAVAPLATLATEVTAAPGLTSPRPWQISGFEKTFVDHGPPKLDDHGSFASDAEAYRAVLARPDLAIVDKFFLARGAGPPQTKIHIGDRVTLSDPAGGNSHTFTIAGISNNDFVENGVLVSESALRQLAGRRAIANRAYIDVANPTAFADSFAGAFLANGAKAETLHHVVQTAMAQQQQFFLLMRTYLALGLIVGIAGIGVIMVRAVRERRRQVGVLRALGFQASAVRAAFVVESAFVAIEGVLIGTFLALVCSWSITLTDAFGSEISFRVPFGAIALLVAGTFVCALLATAGPARSASRIQPAVALRIAD